MRKLGVALVAGLSLLAIVGSSAQRPMAGGKQRPAIGDRHGVVPIESTLCPCFSDAQVADFLMTQAAACPIGFTVKGFSPDPCNTPTGAMEVYCHPGPVTFHLGDFISLDADSFCSSAFQDPVSGDLVYTYFSVDATQKAACQAIIASRCPA